MIDVFLLLGSNLGNRQQYLKQGLTHLTVSAGKLKQASTVYETQSWGKIDSPDYLNQVVLLETELSPGELLKVILRIEVENGRQREEKWGNRTLDIDILFYGDEIINEPNLTVPHPEMHKRRFTLVPMAELAPQYIHPVLQNTIINLKNQLADDLQVKKLYF